MKKIIYDLGASIGENLSYYLLKSDLVIAVEANKKSCELIKKKFNNQIIQKKLIVENCIISDEDSLKDEFYIHKTNHLLSQFPKPKYSLIDNFEKVMIEKKDIYKLINQYGSPYYIKIDLEEYDNIILKRIFDLNINPEYISAEAINYIVINLFLNNKNYNSYKLVEGKNVGIAYKKTKLNINNQKYTYSFPENSAGPFGNDILGKWINKKNFNEFMKFKKQGWRDIHVSLGDKPENINNISSYVKLEKKLEKKVKLIRRFNRFKSKFNFFKND